MPHTLPASWHTSSICNRQRQLPPSLLGLLWAIAVAAAHMGNRPCSSACLVREDAAGKKAYMKARAAEQAADLEAARSAGRSADA